MNVIGLQLDIEWESRRANRERVRAMLENERIEPNSLIVLPEMFATGFSMNIERACEPEGGQTVAFLAKLAREHRSAVIGGVAIQGPDGLGRNEAFAFDPQGQPLARYRKMHPFSFANETEFYEPGDEVVLFSWQSCTIAPVICYDLRFPEIFRKAVRMGANLFLAIANWPSARHAHWEALLKARAIENQAFVVGVNRCGDDPKNAYGGGSQILGPRGETLAHGGSEEGLIRATLDLEALESYRKNFPALLDMREDLL